ncbi:MAG: DUF1624 domain-containing protein [Atopobiaceae bacterium]|nr:DUF1624 domain-containing protein [Atopobiaceae bacterium]
MRGLLLILMVLYHLCYDLHFIAGQDLSFFVPPFTLMWRLSVSAGFLFIAGMMCHLSRSNVRRAAKYGIVALFIWIITTLAAVDTPINFGIIYCMAASTLIYVLLKKLNIVPKGWLWALVFLVAYLALQGLSVRHVWAFGLNIKLPDALYATEYLNWLGFMGESFRSSDYYPILPHSFMFLAGAALMETIKEHPRIMEYLSNHSCKPLEMIGHLSLLIYVIHQPLIMGVLMLLGLV